MSHIHLPDGVLPLWLWLSGYLAISLLIGGLWRWGRAVVEPRRFAPLGLLSAMMILVMMIEVPPFAYHINLSVVTGIVLGPELSVLSALIVNLILAMVGHGGLTVVGLNSFILSAEMIVGFYAFRAVSALRMGIAAKGFAATVVGLASGTGLGYAVIVLGRQSIDRALGAGGAGELGEGLGGVELNLWRLAALMVGIGAVGWVIEGLLSGVILRHLAYVHPELLNAARAEPDGPG